MLVSTKEIFSNCYGKYAIAALLSIIKPANAELLKYYTSADIIGEDYSMAVGYAAIKF